MNNSNVQKNLAVHFRYVVLCSLISFQFLPSVIAKDNLKPTIRNSDDSDEKAITVISESQVSVPPEVGVITLHFTAYGWTVEKAKKKADQLVKRFLEKLAKEKIVPDQIHVGEATLKPSYQFNRDLKTTVPSDFLVSRRITLRVEDLNLIEKIMDVSISIGSFLLESVRLTVKNKSELESKSFKNTLEEGRRKAGEVAKMLQTNLEEIVNVEELDFIMEEIDIIQDTDFSLLAASQIKEQTENPAVPEEKQSSTSGEGSLALSDDDDKSTEQSRPDSHSGWIKARSKLRITFSHR